MCNFASLVLTKDKAHWLADSESHAEIIARCRIVESGARGLNVVKVEITPTGGEIENWPLNWDQDQFPDWHEPVRSERRARVALLAKLKATTLAKLKATTTLYAGSSQITDAGLKHAPKLTTLNAGRSQIGKEARAALRAKGVTVHE